MPINPNITNQPRFPAQSSEAFNALTSTVSSGSPLSREQLETSLAASYLEHATARRDAPPRDKLPGSLFIRENDVRASVIYKDAMAPSGEKYCFLNTLSGRAVNAADAKRLMDEIARQAKEYASINKAQLSDSGTFTLHASGSGSRMRTILHRSSIKPTTQDAAENSVAQAPTATAQRDKSRELQQSPVHHAAPNSAPISDLPKIMRMELRPRTPTQFLKDINDFEWEASDLVNDARESGDPELAERAADFWWLCDRLKSFDNSFTGWELFSNKFNDHVIVLMMAKKQEDALYIDTLATSPDAKGAGLGAIEFAVQHSQNSKNSNNESLNGVVRLEPLNEGVRKYYESLGFIPDGPKKMILRPAEKPEIWQTDAQGIYHFRGEDRAIPFEVEPGDDPWPRSPVSTESSTHHLPP